jgi:hypothetical protein
MTGVCAFVYDIYIYIYIYIYVFILLIVDTQHFASISTLRICRVDPFLVVLIHSLLRRGPWCKTSAGDKACDIPRCGGTRSRDTSYVLNFEDEEEMHGEYYNANFQEMDGVLSRIDSSTAYYGKQSIYFPNRSGPNMFPAGLQTFQPNVYRCCRRTFTDVTISLNRTFTVLQTNVYRRYA